MMFFTSNLDNAKSYTRIDYITFGNGIYLPISRINQVAFPKIIELLNVPIVPHLAKKIHKETYKI